MPHSILLLTDFTAKPLAAAIAARQDGLVPLVGPFDQVAVCLEDGQAECWSASPDFVLVWCRPEKGIPGFRDVLADRPWTAAALKAEVDAFAQGVAAAASRARAVFVASWQLPPWRHGSGPGEFRSGAALALARMNVWLAEALEAIPNAFLLDAGRWTARHGEQAWDDRLWYLAKIPYTASVFADAALAIREAIRGVLGGSRKLVILDLDDTLWGGTVGEIGWRGLRLGGHDPVGEALVDFQARLLALRERGIMLAVVSKNSEEVAIEAIDSHPEMLLRRDTLVGWRINWQDKAANIVDLVRDLNLGLDAAVFIDNDPAERDRVRRALPQVLVPDWPLEKTAYPRALDALPCFASVGVSTEDSARTRMYQEEAVRRASADGCASRDEWLASLGIAVTVEPLNADNLPRAAQLLNKTNQMNLTTRRMTEAELSHWQAGGDRAVFTARVADRFGDYGLTGIVSVDLAGGEARVADFVLSCRVLGRGVEQSLIHAATEWARVRAAVTVRAVLIPTDRNRPCREFFDADPAFEPVAGDGPAWTMAIGDGYPAPPYVALTLEETA